MTDSPFAIVKRTANALTADSPEDDVQEFLDRLRFAEDRMKEIKAHGMEAVRQWVQRNGDLYRPLEGKRYYVGNQTPT